MNDHYGPQETMLARSETAAGAALHTPSSASTVSAKRRRPKTDKELYAEAAERAKSLKEKLLEQRSKNRDRFIEDLYRQFAIEAINCDLDDAERLSKLRATLSDRLDHAPQEVR